MAKYSVVFFGTPEFAARGLKALLEHNEVEVKLVITQPDKPAGRGGRIQSSEVKILAEEKGIKVFQPVSLKKTLKESIETINSFGPFDIGVVIAFGQILPIEILNIPKKGCINVHASLLPRWRGAAPIQRSIISNDKETGVCLMAMDAGLDTGAVYSKAVVQITTEDNFKTLHDELAEEGAALLKNDIIKIINSEILAVPQPEEGVTYAKKITQEDAKINWDTPANQITNLIRGLSPFPAAFAFLDGKRLKIYKAKALEDSACKGMPGEVSFVDKSRLEVSTKEGVISLEEVQLEGKKRMSIKDFLNGMDIKLKTILQ